MTNENYSLKNPNLFIWRGGEAFSKQKSAVYLKDWQCLRFTPNPDPTVKDGLEHDVRDPLPFADNSFENVYAYHVIEHLSPIEGQHFVADIKRILKPQGVIRLSAPNLEDICREYLKYLEASVESRAKDDVLKYEWLVMEMIDQVARDTSGGMMWTHLQQGYYQDEFCRKRFGHVFEDFDPKAPRDPIVSAKPKRKTFKSFLMKIGNALSCIKNKSAQIRNNDPRKTGESHRWMYDRLSLTLLYERQGFTDCQVQSYDSSRIANWERIGLDQSSLTQGPFEPSVYVEARKP